MSWDENTGVDAIDEQLLKAGVPRQVLANLASRMGGANQGDVRPNAPRFTGPRAGVQDVPAPDLDGAGVSSPAPNFRFMSAQPAAPIASPTSRFTGAQSQRLPSTIEELKKNPGNLLMSAATPRFTNPSGSGSRYDGVVAQSPADGKWLAEAKFREQAANNGEVPDSDGRRVVQFSDGGSERRPIEDESRDLWKTEPTRAQYPVQKMPAWKKLLGGALSTAAGIDNPNMAAKTADAFFTSPQRKADDQFNRAHGDWKRQVGDLTRTAKLRHDDLEDQNLQSEIDARNRPRAEKPENLDREAYDYYVGQGMTPAAARQRVLKDAQDVKPEHQMHTSPFEAFAYGDAKEKKAAQDFLDMEHRLGGRYRNPTEFDEKYRLFKQDPEAYKAMFGDKTKSAPDRATATRMLNYFDKRRREVNGDFTLEDDQKKQQLQEIENLERPFMDAVQPGAAQNSGADRVNVISPDGRRGHIPRSQLGAAKNKGYKEIQ